MISLITVSSAQSSIADHCRARRVQLGLTQQGLAERAGVCLPTLRKFEQKGLISLESFLKIAMVLGLLENILNATTPVTTSFSTIDDVVKANQKVTRKRGWRT